MQIRRQAAHIVMGLDRTALQNIRIDGTLGQETNPLQLAGLLLEHPDKLRADDLPLLLRLAYPCQLVQEPVHRVHIDQIGVHLIPEYPDHLLRLALAQQAVVYMHAHQLLANGPDQQRRHHGGIYPAGQCQ